MRCLGRGGTGLSSDDDIAVLIESNEPAALLPAAAPAPKPTLPYAACGHSRSKHTHKPRQCIRLQGRGRQEGTGKASRHHVLEVESMGASAVVVHRAMASSIGLPDTTDTRVFSVPRKTDRWRGFSAGDGYLA